MQDMDLNLKDYLLQACNFLSIGIEQTSKNDFRLLIPDSLSEYFNNCKEFLVTFDKQDNDSNKTYITNEAFLIQKIAKLVANLGHGVTTGEIKIDGSVTAQDIEALFPDCKIDSITSSDEPRDYLVVCVKITMKLNKVEEFLHCYKYDIKDNTCCETEVPSDAYIQKILTKSFSEYDKEKILSYYENIIPLINSTASEHFKEKQTEYAKMCSDEIDRINEYYDILLKENSLPEATEEFSMCDTLNTERENLINEQKKKFHISDNNVIIEPITVSIIREIADRVNAELSNDFGKVNLCIANSSEIRCFYTKSQNAPFTITSDNHICSAENTFICSDCKGKFYTDKKQVCDVCGNEVCADCAATSASSGKVLCKEHSHICTSCNSTVAQDEAFKCERCNKELCTVCSQIHHCEICEALICDSCKIISASSGRVYCEEHIAHCPVCGSIVGADELHKCSNCGISHCKDCGSGSDCSLCRGIKPINKNDSEVAQLISEYNLKASSYEFNKVGNLVIIIGKKLFGKSFLVIIDTENRKIVNRINYGLFGNQK